MALRAEDEVAYGDVQVYRPVKLAAEIAACEKSVKKGLLNPQTISISFHPEVTI